VIHPRVGRCPSLPIPIDLLACRTLTFVPRSGAMALLINSRWHAVVDRESSCRRILSWRADAN
jgi:hypothetical protein